MLKEFTYVRLIVILHLFEEHATGVRITRLHMFQCQFTFMCMCFTKNLIILGLI